MKYVIAIIIGAAVAAGIFLLVRNKDTAPESPSPVNTAPVQTQDNPTPAQPEYQTPYGTPAPTYATPYPTPYKTPYNTPAPYGTPYPTPYQTPYGTPYQTPYSTPPYNY